MTLIRIITILILLTLAFSLKSQSTAFILKSIDSTSIQNIYIDPLDRVYFQYSNCFIKKDLNTMSIDTINVESTASNYFLDTKFPLKTLLFLKQKNQIKIINSRAGILSVLNLDMIQIFQAKYCLYSSDGLIWIYNDFDNSLYKVNENNQVKFKKSQPFNLADQKFNIAQLLDIKNQLFALDTTLGILILNNYGDLMKRIDIKGVHDIVNYKKKVLLFTDTAVFVLNENTYQVEKLEWTLPINTPINNVIILHNTLFVLTQKGILYEYDIKN